MTPQELKNSILQLAIQGKLVEQRPEEGTAEELYRQIQAEKQRLIKAGKIKKEQTLPEITEDENPFYIPESWKWVRWGDLSESIQYGYNAAAQAFGRIKMVRISDIQDGQVLWDTVPFCNINENDIATYLLRKNDILFARTGGTVGKSYLVNEVPEESIYAGYLIRTRYSSLLCPEYMKHFMESQLYWTQLRNGTIATAQPNCNGKTLSQMILPLPPLSEQKRIVAKIDELLPYIDRYEKAWSKLEDFNKRFPTDMQKSILQFAIQGKLVEQRPEEEGTGEELYRQIQAEKQRLIKAGKIKKEKPLPEIADNEKPFDIPENWKWVRLPSVASLCLGKMLDRQKNTGNPMSYLRNVNVRWGHFDLDDLLEMKFDDVDSERFLIRKGDLVICEGGEPGRCAVWQCDSTIHFQKALHRVRFLGDIDSMLYQFAFQYFSANGLLNAFFTGTTIKHLTGQALEKILIPLPPLAEQKRIVAKLEEILPLCDKLK